MKGRNKKLLAAEVLDKAEFIEPEEIKPQSCHFQGRFSIYNSEWGIWGIYYAQSSILRTFM